MSLAIVNDDGRSLKPAPERAGLPSLWALDPTDLQSLAKEADFDGSTAHLFGRIQRVAEWSDDGVDVGKRARLLLDRTDRSLPTIVEEVPSDDGSTRMVLLTADGHKIEAVHMPRDHVKNPRTTFCISSQVGCAMGCTFCATGTMGIVRNLSAGEIVGQVIALMKAKGPKTGHSLNLVFMGMGEPLHNLEHVARAVKVLCDERGIGLSEKRITVSTSGLVPQIERMAQLDVRPMLAVSINAADDETRSRVMPVNRAWNLATLKKTLQSYPWRRGEKVLLAYVLLKGENDSDDDAARLADFASGLPANLNLIPLNEHARTSHKAPDDAWIAAFSKRLYEELAQREFRGVLTTRNNRGRDVQGACGQLVQGEVKKPSRSG
ncbi:MAG: 23S rRNA (adenine(2503)-C(2))-methyltransferase RlmN [Deltaproteobacteria bacterium]|nr:23S rRNA (adenine(2503)-C(2))-methyltransferase RlmN [Deltaproteobacteria bacterium]